MTPTPAPETSMFPRAIFTIVEDTDFSQNDMDNAFEILMNKPWVAEMYGAIIDVSAHTHFLYKCLNEQAEKFNDIQKMFVTLVSIYKYYTDRCVCILPYNMCKTWMHMIVSLLRIEISLIE